MQRKWAKWTLAIGCTALVPIATLVAVELWRIREEKALVERFVAAGDDGLNELLDEIVENQCVRAVPAMVARAAAGDSNRWYKPHPGLPGTWAKQEDPSWQQVFPTTPTGRIAATIERLGGSATTPLVSMLHSEDAMEQRWAAYFIGRLGTRAEAAANDLVQCFHDDGFEVRKAAAIALGRTSWCTPEAFDGLLPTLLAPLDDGDADDLRGRDTALEAAKVLALEAMRWCAQAAAPDTDADEFRATTGYYPETVLTRCREFPSRVAETFGDAAWSGPPELRAHVICAIAHLWHRQPYLDPERVTRLPDLDPHFLRGVVDPNPLVQEAAMEMVELMGYQDRVRDALVAAAEAPRADPEIRVRALKRLRDFSHGDDVPWVARLVPLCGHDHEATRNAARRTADDVVRRRPEVARQALPAALRSKNVRLVRWALEHVDLWPLRRDWLRADVEHVTREGPADLRRLARVALARIDESTGPPRKRTGPLRHFEK